MVNERDANVVAAAIDGLAELQVFREAMERSNQPFEAQVATLLATAVDFYVAAMPLKALLLADRHLADGFPDVARRTGLGPHTPIVELAAWVRHQIDVGHVPMGTDPRCAALVVCGVANSIAEMRVLLPPDVTSEVNCCATEMTVDLVLRALTGRHDLVPVEG